MKTYKILFKINSSVITPLQADTFFGCICWAIRYLYGESSLVEFLETYKEEPPIILSDGYPEGFISKPILKPITYDKVVILAEDLFGKSRKSLMDCILKIKKLRKIKYLHISDFENLKENLSEFTLLKLLLNKEQTQPKIFSTLVFRNTINRKTNTVLLEGGLHPSEETFYTTNINIFLKTEFRPEKLKTIFEYICLSGFGRSASSGKGAMEFISIEETKLPLSKNPNAFMSLSCFIPKKTDPQKGYYQIFTKYGKLGGDYARSRNPFKKPLLMFTSGSVFIDNPVKEYYGGLVEKVCDNSNIKHYAYAFPIGVKLDENI
ncbi:MAG: hypothetical protein ABDH23_04870 [Endomicrobiia bacterium]